MVFRIDNIREKIDEFYEKDERGEDPGEFIVHAMDSTACGLGYIPIHINVNAGRYAVEAVGNTSADDFINAFTEMGLKVRLDEEADPSEFAPLVRITI